MTKKLTPSVRGGSPLPQQDNFLSQQVGSITVVVDSKLSAENPGEPIKITHTGFWLLRSIKITNACCASLEN